MSTVLTSSPMVSAEDAILWLNLNLRVGGPMRKKVMSRVQYECARGVPVPPRIQHGSMFKTYFCGNCRTHIRAGDRFCAKCGFAIKWEE